MDENAAFAFMRPDATKRDPFQNLVSLFDMRFYNKGLSTGGKKGRRPFPRDFWARLLVRSAGPSTP